MDPGQASAPVDFEAARHLPVLPPRAAEKIVALLAACSCFSAPRLPPSHGGQPPGRQAFQDGRLRGRRGGFAGPRGDGGKWAHRREGPRGRACPCDGDCRCPPPPGGARPPRGHGDGDWHPPPSRRTAVALPKDAVLGNLNKLARTNYPVILRKLRLVLSDENVCAALASILGKAYREPDSTALCIELLRDVYSGLGDGAKLAAIAFVSGQVDDAVAGLRGSVALPGVDPATDYGAFCDVNAKKRAAVGRSRTLYSLLDRGLLPLPRAGASADAFFTTHVSLLGSLVVEAADPQRLAEPFGATGGAYPSVEPFGADPSVEPFGADPSVEPFGATGGAPGAAPACVDVLAAVEVLLDCCDAMVRENDAKRSEVRRMVEDVGGEGAFPSSRSRFKVRDIIQRGAGRRRAM